MWYSVTWNINMKAEMQLKDVYWSFTVSDAELYKTQNTEIQNTIFGRIPVELHQKTDILSNITFVIIGLN